MTLARPWVAVGFRLRLAAAGIGLSAVAILMTAAWLRPDARGHGTHEQLGLPPCGFIITSGLPCPTCGMTTAFSLMMHGHPLKAIWVQPMGAALCLATIATLGIAFVIAIGGRMPRIEWDRINPVRWLLGFGLMLACAWGFTIARVILTRSN